MAAATRNYATVVTENNNSNIRIIANNITLQNWGASNSNLSINLAAASNFTVMTITGSNVGIRTTSPTAALDIIGNLNVSGSITRNGFPLATTNWGQCNSTTFLSAAGQLGIGTTNAQGFDIYCAGTISASNIIARNVFLANDSQYVRNALQLAPVRSNLTLKTASQSSFVIDQTGIYTVSNASNVDVYVNGLKLVYRSPTVKDYDVSYQWIGLSNTRYTVTLAQPVVFGDIVDIAIWPSFYNTTTCNMPGYVYQQFGSYQWENQGTSNTIARGNVGIGTTVPQYLLDVASGTTRVTNTLVITSNTGPATIETAVGTRFNMTPVFNTRSGLVGWYTGDSWNTGTSVWTDLSGAGNHTISTTGTVNVATITGTNVKYLYGGQAVSITFPTAILPTTYTLFHVAKYNGLMRGRIVTRATTGASWLSGFFGGYTGFANHGGTDIGTNGVDLHGTNWVISTDQNNLYRSQGTQRGTGTGGINVQLGINTYTGEKSDWAVSEIIVFNGTLTQSEIDDVESYLINKYANITTGFPANYVYTAPIRTTISGMDEVVVNSIGNVGIGTTLPLYSLDVAGTTKVSFSPDGRTIPSVGMLAWYTGNSWNGSQWLDVSGNGCNVTNVTNAGSILSAPMTTLSSTQYIYGNTTTGMTFPAAILPASYTLFTVARYNNATANQARIFTSSNASPNWLCGFSNQMSGVAVQNGYNITPLANVHGNNWVVSTMKSTYYYASQGTSRQTNVSVAPFNANMTINGFTGEKSDWAVAEVIVYSRELSSAETSSVESYLFNKYVNYTTGFPANYTYFPITRVGVNNSEIETTTPMGVGIGMTNPQYRLDVAGPMRTTGFISQSYTVTFDSTANGVRNIATINGTTQCFDITVVGSQGNMQVTKYYTIPTVYGQTAPFVDGTWYLCMPISQARNSANIEDAELLVRCTSSQVTFRLVHSVVGLASSPKYTINITCKYPQTSVPFFIDLTTNAQFVDALWATYAICPTTPLTQSNSRVGVNTSNPSAPFHVMAPGGSFNTIFEATSSWAGINIRNTNASTTIGVANIADNFFTGAQPGDMAIRNTSGCNVHLGPYSSAPTMTLTSTSNVGIGTTNPQYKLDVNGSARMTGFVVRSFNKSIDNTVNNVYDIARFGTDTSYAFDITISGCQNYVQFVKTYTLVTSYPSGIPFNDSTQYVCVPITQSRNSVNPDDVDLLITVVAGSGVTFRIVHTTIGQNPVAITVNIVCKYPTNTTPIVTDLTSNSPSVNNSWSSLLICPTTAITQKNGNIGVGTTTPQCKLDVAGIARAQSFQSKVATNVTVKDTDGAITLFTLGVADKGLYILSSGCIKWGTWDNTIQFCSIINIGSDINNTTAYGNLITNLSIHGNLTLTVVQNGNNVDIKLSTSFNRLTLNATLLKLSEPSP